jgi:hypothetical protein
MPTEFIDLFDLPLSQKSAVHLGRFFHTRVHGDYPGTDKAVWERSINRCMRFTLGMTVKSGRLAASGSLLL